MLIFTICSLLIFCSTLYVLSLFFFFFFFLLLEGFALFFFLWFIKWWKRFAASLCVFIYVYCRLSWNYFTVIGNERSNQNIVVDNFGVWLDKGKVNLKLNFPSFFFLSFFFLFTFLIFPNLYFFSYFYLLFFTFGGVCRVFPFGTLLI